MINLFLQFFDFDYKSCCRWTYGLLCDTVTVRVNGSNKREKRKVVHCSTSMHIKYSVLGIVGGKDKTILNTGML